MQFNLPFPVPLAACFIRSKGGTGIPSKRYRAYRNNAQQMMREQGVQMIHGPVSVHIDLKAPDRRKRDADNLFKCLFDNLSGIAIEDDNNRIVRHASWTWVDDGPACQVTIKKCEAWKSIGALAKEIENNIEVKK